jgi:hypothetical protein
LPIQGKDLNNSDSLTVQNWLAFWEWEYHFPDSSKIYSLPRTEVCSIPAESCRSNVHAIINFILTEPLTLYVFAQKKRICNVLGTLLAVACTRCFVFCILREYSERLAFSQFILSLLKFIFFNYFVYINYVKCNLRMTS